MTFKLHSNVHVALCVQCNAIGICSDYNMLLAFSIFRCTCIYLQSRGGVAWFCSSVSCDVTCSRNKLMCVVLRCCWQRWSLGACRGSSGRRWWARRSSTGRTAAALEVAEAAAQTHALSSAPVPPTITSTGEEYMYITAAYAHTDTHQHTAVDVANARLALHARFEYDAHFETCTCWRRLLMITYRSCRAMKSVKHASYCTCTSCVSFIH